METTPSASEALSVVTYNVLSSALATPGWFRHCNPQDLDVDTRLARVIQKLSVEIGKRAIICLQEVSRDWSGKLHAFFQQNNYTFILSSYGIAISGYMGVAIGFPNEKWTAIDVDIRRIADTKEYWHEAPTVKREYTWRPTTEVRAGDWTCPSCGANVFAGKVACFRCHAPKPEPVAKPVTPAALDGFAAFWGWLTARCGASSLPSTSPAPASVTAPAPAAPRSVVSSGHNEAPSWYEAARRKENTMIAVHLRSATHPQLTLWCGTYHMPCAFDQPQLMVMHAALAMQHLQGLAAATSAPCLLGGDWNIKPGDPAYALLTTATMDPTLESSPKMPGGDSWSPSLPCAMRSAYQVVHGQEPDFTNYAQSAKDTAPFIGCLDYVFCSPHFRVLSAPALPRREDYLPGGPLPTASEPSDHLLVSVELELSQPDASHANVYAMPAPAPAAPVRVAPSKPGREEANARLEAAKLAELEAFVASTGETVLTYPASLNSYERRVVHALAEKLGLQHTSHGEGRNRYIRVEKPPLQPFSGEGHRLVSDGETPSADPTPEDVRAARLAALEMRSK